MKYYVQSIKIVFFIVLLALGLTLFFSFTPTNPMKVLRKQMSLIQKSYTIGSSSYMLDEHAFANYGVSECRGFAMLLRDRLQEQGYSSRIVGIVSSKGGAHNLLEVKLGDRWVLADPMSNVLYKNSLIDILLNPSLAKKAIRPIQMSNDIKTITSPDFFANALAIDFGEFYLSDRLRWTPLSAKGKYNSENLTYSCPKSHCSWNLSISTEILNDKLFASLPMIKIISFGVDVVVSDEQNINFLKLKSGEFLPQIITPKNGKLRISSSAIGPHKIEINVGVSPTDNIQSLHLRTPKPMVLIFRNSEIDFYGANLKCNEIEVWSKKLEQDGEGELFNNAFFLNPHSNESAWSNLVKRNRKIFRHSRLDLPGNEARVRLQPLLIEHHNDTQCNITFNYMAKKPVEVFLHAEVNNHLFALGKLPRCTHNVCSKKIELDKNSIFSMYSVGKLSVTKSSGAG